jgi:diaminopimelate epimerase
MTPVRRPTPLRFSKAHAYGNDFLYLRRADVGSGIANDRLARELCDRHTGIGADGLIIYDATADGASMRLWNADGSRSEVSGNGVRGLAALLLRDDERADVPVTIDSEGGVKRLVRTGRAGSRHTFRAAMGLPADLRQVEVTAAGEPLQVAVMTFGNPQCVALGPLPDEDRFRRLGPALEHHAIFPARSNIEFADVEAPDRVRILIWERGVGPTMSSGTGSCASLIAAAAFGGAARDAQVIAPGGAQRVEWLEDSVYLTGWAEVLFDGEWLRTQG